MELARGCSENMGCARFFGANSISLRRYWLRSSFWVFRCDALVVGWGCSKSLDCEGCVGI